MNEYVSPMDTYYQDGVARPFIQIGENVWVAPSTSILNKKNVASNSVMGMGAVVLKDVTEGQVIIGNPGKPLTK